MARLLAASVVLLFAGPAFADGSASDNDQPPPAKMHGHHAAPSSPGTPRAHRTVPPPTTPTVAVVGGSGGANDYAEGGPTPHSEGTYGGVAPDQPHPADATATTAHPKPKRLPPKGTLTWIGFEAKDGGAEVFFQSVAPFAVAQSIEGSTLVVMLTGLSRQVINTRRPIDTHFFDNPLAAITAHAVGAARATKTRAAHSAGIEVRIAFKNPKDAREATVRAATEADGMYYNYLAFPEGADVPAATAPTMQTPEQ